MTPFVTPLVGVGATAIFGHYIDADLAFGAGFGTEVNFNRNFGFRVEVRGTRGIETDWQARPIFSAFFRYGQ